jgi:hypothetical protein
MPGYYPYQQFYDPYAYYGYPFEEKKLRKKDSSKVLGERRKRRIKRKTKRRDEV